MGEHGVVDRILRVSDEIQNAAERRRVRLFLTFLLIVFPLRALYVALNAIFVEGYTQSAGPAFAGLALVIVCFFLGRTRHYRAAIFLVAMVPGTVTAGMRITADQSVGWFAFAMIGPFMASVLLPTRMAAIPGAYTLIVIYGTVFGYVGLENTEEAFVALLFPSVVVPALFLAAAHRDGVERDRQAELERSRQELATLLEYSPDGMATLDLAGRVQTANPAVGALLGRPLADIIGRNALDVVPFKAHARKRLERRFKNLVEGDMPLPTEFEIPAGGGRDTVVIEANARLLEGKPLVQVTLRDISGRRAAERLRVQLYEAQRMESLGRLAGGVAHDFNNLLQVIQGHGQLLQESEALTEDDQDDVSQILNAAQSASGLTRQLLTYSRRGQDEDDEVLSPNEVLRELQEMLRRLLGNVEMTLDLGDDAPDILLDQSQFEQVVVNLIVNARDAMPEGGVVEVATSAVNVTDSTSELPVEPGRYLELRVRDSGTGISDEIKQRIFDPFFSTKAPGRGTGLGLSTVLGIVTRAGGHLTVESRPGEGASFSLLFPQADSATDDVPSAKDENDSEPSGPATILLVEDDQAVQTAISRMLKRDGYRVVCAHNGESARACLDEHPEVALVISDVLMPGERGPDLVAALRKSRPELPAMLVSGYDPEWATNGHDEALPLLQKPFTPVELRRAIATLLTPQSGE
jgi:two-component system cell cycle sensor histidine kinase/response regulator CckA